MPPGSQVRYDERPLAVALPALLSAINVGPKRGTTPVVVACHACAHLTLQIVEMASVACAPMIAVMPCCHSAKVLGSKWKAAADALAMPLGVFADVALVGALGARGYETQLLIVNGCAETSNRLVLGQIPPADARSSGAVTAQGPSTPSLWPIGVGFGLSSSRHLSFALVCSC